MTTEEKQRRKTAAKRHRNQTPAVIVPPVNQESNDLKEAAVMKLRPKDTVTEENPAGNTLPAVSDQIANDPTTNTQPADDFIEEVNRDDVPPVGEEIKREPTNEDLATAMANAANAGEFEPDPIEVWFSEKSLAFKNWLAVAPGKALDAVIDGWIKLDGHLHDTADKILSWSYKTNAAFGVQWNKWFPVKATRDELAEAMNFMAQYVSTGLDEVKQMVASKNTVDRGRLDSLLFAVQANQKVRATKLYASLTGADLGTAKEAIEALA